MNITFQGSNAGVTAESIGAEPPACPEKTAPVVDSFGNWQCAGTGAGSTGGGISTLLMAAVVGGLYWWFYAGGRQKFSALTGGGQ